MDDSLYHEIGQLPGMTVEQLQQRYEEVFGEPSRSQHKLHLIRRIGWRLQVLAEGDLPERARQRALAIARDADTIVHANAHHMMTAIERVQDVFARSKAAGNEVTAIKRLD